MPDPTPKASAPNHPKRSMWGWALYDWANSAFATTIMAGFFPGFFKQFWSQGVDVNLSTARLGMGNALASLVVALLAPVMGAMADRSAGRKRFLIVFAYLGVLATAALPLVPMGSWQLALLIYGLGIVGFSGSIVFYDALLPEVAPVQRLDQVSSLGYALGYLGGGLLFVLNVAVTLHPAMFGLRDATQAVRLSFLSVALWWGGFALWSFYWIPPDPVVARVSLILQVRAAIRQLSSTFRKIRRRKMIFLFLLAYWCYIDGVDTIVRMAVDYGISLGFAFQDLIVALLITQFIGFPAALLFGFLGNRWGARRSIYLALGIYMAVTLWGAAMNQTYEFYVLAGVIGLVQGGIQALSRSYYARLIPPQQSAEYYGFYNMLGKFAAIVGPALMGITGLIVRAVLLPSNPDPDQLQAVGLTATRASIVSVLLLFVAGAVLLYFVDERRAQAEKYQ